MDHDFWHTRWSNNQINFHEGMPNDLLVAHVDTLDAQPGDNIFVPLCGKTKDMAWLHAQGLHVVGAELSCLAVEQFFAEQGLTPTVIQTSKLMHYSAPGYDLFAGDIFDMSPDNIGPIQAVYDRAASIALPPDMRRHYVAHLAHLTNTAPQLLVTLAYDETRFNGPPFSIPDAAVQDYYGAAYTATQLAARETVIKETPCLEAIWHLDTKT